MRKVAGNLRTSLVDNVAKTLEKTPLTVCVSINRLEGRVLAWLPPPPSDRLFYSFLDPPILEAKTNLANVHPLVAKSPIVQRASKFFESKIRSAIVKNLMFPGCNDVHLKFLLPVAADDAFTQFQCGFEVPPDGIFGGTADELELSAKQRENVDRAAVRLSNVAKGNAESSEPPLVLTTEERYLGL